MEMQVSNSRHHRIKKKKILKWTSIIIHVLMLNWIATIIGSASKYVTEAGTEAIQQEGLHTLLLLLIWIGIIVLLWFIKLRIKK